MDFNLDIVLPASWNVNDLEIDEDFIQWGEEIYPCDPPVYHWRDKLRLEKNTLPLMVEQRLNHVMACSNYHVFTCKGSSLSELEWAVNHNNDVTTHPIVEFIDTVLIHWNGWCLILSLDDEKIDRVEYVNNASIHSFILLDGLKWTKPHGVIIYNS